MIRNEKLERGTVEFFFKSSFKEIGFLIEHRIEQSEPKNLQKVRFTLKNV
jgi:hypothetical protein